MPFDSAAQQNQQKKKLELFLRRYSCKTKQIRKIK